jgi:hypothetical protein
MLSLLSFGNEVNLGPGAHLRSACNSVLFLLSLIPSANSWILRNPVHAPCCLHDNLWLSGNSNSLPCARPPELVDNNFSWSRHSRCYHCFYHCHCCQYAIVLLFFPSMTSTMPVNMPSLLLFFPSMTSTLCL